MAVNVSVLWAIVFAKKPHFWMIVPEIISELAPCLWVNAPRRFHVAERQAHDVLGKQSAKMFGKGPTWASPARNRSQRTSTFHCRGDSTLLVCHTPGILRRYTDVQRNAQLKALAPIKAYIKRGNHDAEANLLSILLLVLPYFTIFTIFYRFT